MVGFTAVKRTFRNIWAAQTVLDRDVDKWTKLVGRKGRSGSGRGEIGEYNQSTGKEICKELTQDKMKKKSMFKFFF